MSIDTDLLDPTDILHSPREFARRYENLAAQLAQAQAERDAERREVARLTAAHNKVAEKIELWIHDTDQFSPRTSAEDMVVQDGQLEELARIVKALRGQPAPARAEAEE